MREFTEKESERIRAFRAARCLVKEKPNRYRIEFCRLPFFGLWFQVWDRSEIVYFSDLWRPRG